MLRTVRRVRHFRSSRRSGGEMSQAFSPDNNTAKMGDVPLYLTKVNVSVGQSVDVQWNQSPKSTRDFEHVELADTEREHRREKTPRRIIHFSSGETMEEYSTDEEEEEEEDEDKEPERKDLLSPSVDASKMTWGPYFWFHMWKAATSTISACDYLGERMASLFGITSAKYQYAIDEYYKMKKEKEEEKEENRLSEEAERSFDQSHFPEGGDPVTKIELPAAAPDVNYKIRNESLPPSDTVVVPAIVTAT
ncbi:protein FAM177A1-like [Vanacampus margaritifer]